MITTKPSIHFLLRGVCTLSRSILPVVLLLCLSKATMAQQACFGNADFTISSSSETNADNALGVADGTFATLYTNGNQIVLDLSDYLSTGSTYTIRWRRAAGSPGNPSVAVAHSQDASTWATATGSPITVSNTSFSNQTITVSGTTRYLRFTTQNDSDLDIDAISYNTNCQLICTGNGRSLLYSQYASAPTRSLGPVNATASFLTTTNSELVIDLEKILNSGQTYTLRWAKVVADATNVTVEESLDGVNFTTATGSPFNITTQNAWVNQNIVTSTQTRFIRIKNNNLVDVYFDAVTYTSTSASCDDSPNFFTRGEDGTCSGTTINNDASAVAYKIINANRVGISSANAGAYDGVNYASASTISSNSFTFTNLQHNTDYIIRAYNGSDGNFTDMSVSIISAPCELPSDLPWTPGDCGILVEGIAAATCGVTTSVEEHMRWSFGMVDIKNSIPASGRVDQSGNQAMYHHSSWHIDEIGNVYGIAINQTTGDVFLTASANYGAGFLGQNSIIQYGNIGGGPSSLAAAGTVYRIDGFSGQASVFAVLPQQSVTFSNDDCESADIVTRTSGVGLGNIAYDEVHNQYFVSNIEDGRIYRLDAAGTILDSYDPLIYDNGVPGITNLEDLVYGLAVEPNGNRLFFGMVDTPNGGAGIAGIGAVPIYSVALTGSGGFTGTIDNTNMPSGATYDNYVDADFFHTNIATGSSAASSTFATNTTYLISDLEFAPNGNLLASVRVGCENSFFTSYNHWGETNVITDGGTGTYNNSITELNVSVTGDAAIEDGYGGVAVYELQDGSNQVHYVVTSSDILDEAGPHGLAVFNSTTTNSPLSPIAAISYGNVDTGDPKGMGGDVQVFSACECTEPTASTSSAQGTCAANTSTPNNDASIAMSSISDGTRIAISSANAGSFDGSYFADATVIVGNSHTFSNLQHDASYIIRIYNNGGVCYTDFTVQTPELSPPTLTPVNDALLCNGDANGSVSVNVSGGNPSFSYTWSTGASTSSINNLSAGTYSVTVTDQSECTASATTTVTEPSSISITATPNHVTVKHGYDGSISTTVTGGTPTYTYQWSNGETTSSINSLSAGTYTVTVTDANDCSQTAEITITQPACPPNVRCGRVTVTRN